MNRTGGPSKKIEVIKWWGKEVTHYNDDYCCKVLYMNEMGATSMHFHLHKHETLLVVDGELTIEILFDKTVQKFYLSKGDAFVMPPGLAHKLINSGTKQLIIVEASTYDSPEDSIRIS